LDATFAALADPTRRAILARLASGDASVTELAEPFSMSQPAISKAPQSAGARWPDLARLRRPSDVQATPSLDRSPRPPPGSKTIASSGRADFKRLDALLGAIQTVTHKDASTTRQ